MLPINCFIQKWQIDIFNNLLSRNNWKIKTLQQQSSIRKIVKKRIHRTINKLNSQRNKKKKPRKNTSFILLKWYIIFHAVQSEKIPCHSVKCRHQNFKISLHLSTHIHIWVKIFFFLLFFLLMFLLKLFFFCSMANFLCMDYDCIPF